MGYSKSRNFRDYNPEEPLVAARSMTLMGVDMKRGDPVDLEAVPVATRRRLWMVHRINYAKDHRPTAELDAEPGSGGDDPTKGVKAEHTGGGFYTVTAPWLAEPERVKGKEAAEARVAELIEQGPPAPEGGEGSEGEGGEPDQGSEDGEGTAPSTEGTAPSTEGNAGETSQTETGGESAPTEE